MAKTFNRNPLQVNTPSNSDIKNYFFNHYNWKGVDKNKNFLAVDQETFADAKNVYIADNGTLCSRPSVKRTLNFAGINEITDIEVFDDIVVCESPLGNSSDVCTLSFIKENGVYSTTTSKPYKLVKGGNRFFIFANDRLGCFDSTNNSFIGNTIYTPTTTFDAAGVKTKTESKNVLTDSEIYVYLYNNLTGVSVDAYGKTLRFKVNGVEYEILFDDKAPDLITDIKFTQPESFDTIEVSVNDTYLFYSSSSSRLVYSATGRVFTTTWDLSGETMVIKPKFSRDGNYIVYATNEGVYIIGVVVDNSIGTIRYPNPTRIDTTAVGFETLNMNSVEAIDFVSYDHFAIVNWVSSDNQDGTPADTYLIQSARDERLTTITTTLSRDIIDVICSNAGLWVLYDLAYTNDVPNYSYCAAFMYDENLSVDYQLYFDDTFVTYRDYDDSTKFLIAGEEGLTLWTFDYETGNTESVSIQIDSGEFFTSGAGAFSSDGTRLLLTDHIYYIDKNELVPLIVKDNGEMVPVAFTDYLYYKVGNNVFSNLIDGSLELTYYKMGNNHYLLPDFVTKLDEYYFAKDETLYISEYREKDGDLLWYFPENNKHLFDYPVTNLTPISTTEIAAFFENEIWYVRRNELGYNATKSKFDIVYTVTKSKLDIGLRKGSDVATSYDGKQTLFCSKDGFVALSYQDFVASTDQVVTFLSDVIRADMESYGSIPVRLFKKGFWLILYNNSNGEGYIFDFRNNSWWPISYNRPIKKMFAYDDEIRLLIDGKIYRLDTSVEDYYDYDGERHIIDWFLTSQKLHLSASNYYKHIVNITLSSVTDDQQLLTYAMDIVNYRKTVDQAQSKLLQYKVQVIRTFVQRLNHFKVNEFQYTLKTDHEEAIQVPLNVSDISIKYRISGQVR